MVLVSRVKIKEFLDSPSLVTQVTNAPDLTAFREGRLEFNAVSVTAALINSAAR